MEYKKAPLQEFQINQAFAVLFAQGGSVSAEALSNALGVGVKGIPEIIEQLKNSIYCRLEAPLTVEEIAGGYRLITRPAYGETIRRSGLENKTMEKLSSAALETLAVIAWRQPITKTEIDKLRNADSEKALNRLKECGMVTQIGDLNRPGSPGVFQTTGKFLEHFGLKNLQTLPEINSPAP